MQLITYHGIWLKSSRPNCSFKHLFGQLFVSVKLKLSDCSDNNNTVFDIKLKPYETVGREITGED